jgi:hypothetical protein
MDRQISTHPMFAAVFATWLRQADALSALPDAPVVPDEPRPGPPSRASSWLVQYTSRIRSLAGARPRPTQAQNRPAPECATRVA